MEKTVQLSCSSLVMELETKSETVFASFVMECYIHRTEQVLLFMCPNESLSIPIAFPSHLRTIGNIWRVAAYLVTTEKW